MSTREYPPAPSIHGEKHGGPEGVEVQRVASSPFWGDVSQEVRVTNA